MKGSNIMKEITRFTKIEKIYGPENAWECEKCSEQMSLNPGETIYDTGYEVCPVCGRTIE